jgi:hypothetical protein
MGRRVAETRSRRLPHAASRPEIRWTTPTKSPTTPCPPPVPAPLRQPERPARRREALRGHAPSPGQCGHTQCRPGGPGFARARLPTGQRMELGQRTTPGPDRGSPSGGTLRSGFCQRPEQPAAGFPTGTRMPRTQHHHRAGRHTRHERGHPPAPQGLRRPLHHQRRQSGQCPSCLDRTPPGGRHRGARRTGPERHDRPRRRGHCPGAGHPGPQHESEGQRQGHCQRPFRLGHAGLRLRLPPGSAAVGRNPPRRPSRHCLSRTSASTEACCGARRPNGRCCWSMTRKTSCRPCAACCAATATPSSPPPAASRGSKCWPPTGWMSSSPTSACPA